MFPRNVEIYFEPAISSRSVCIAPGWFVEMEVRDKLFSVGDRRWTLFAEVETEKVHSLETSMIISRRE